MARRTRKQKEEAKHAFTVSWKPRQELGESESKKVLKEASVKGQFKKDTKLNISEVAKKKKAVDSTRYAELASVKRKIGRSVILASLILSLELVIYLIWSQ